MVRFLMPLNFFNHSCGLCFPYMQKREIHVEFWTILQILCLDFLGKELELETVHWEFEFGAHKAGRAVLPTSEILGKDSPQQITKPENG